MNQGSNTKPAHPVGATTNNQFTALEWTVAEATRGLNIFYCPDLHPRFCFCYNKNSEYDQEIPQSQTAYKAVAS